MSAVTIIFPHQLFANHPAISSASEVWLIEDALFFSQLAFHKQKIMLHRASMKQYQAELEKRGLSVSYFNAVDYPTLELVFRSVSSEGIREIHYAEVHDYLLQRRLARYARQYTIKAVAYKTPAFISSREDIVSISADSRGYFLHDFYIAQRKRWSVLIKDGLPVGGKWSFDHENRKRLPPGVYIPPLPELAENECVREAKRYIDRYYSHNPGSTDNFRYPVSRAAAIKWFDHFLRDRLVHYGPYQDAIKADNSFLFHAVITPALNIGLLTPDEILERLIEFSRVNDVPINSIEGFVRQILGWREFVALMYFREGVYQRTANHWKHTRTIPESFWNGTTGIDPIDNVIGKVIQTGYSNHIERLMIIGNFMLLCEFAPDEVYRWFMSLYIDAYDWVMVPNIYGMSQFSDGGLISTKPYISGSNYILKMSNFKKGPWCEVWDALYWSFIGKHQNEFSSNPRMSMMVAQYRKMSDQQINKFQSVQTEFLTELDSKIN